MKSAFVFDRSVLDLAPDDWARKPMWSAIRRQDRSGMPDAELLSVYRDHGVVPKSSRDDNFNKESEDLGAYRYVQPGDLVMNKMKTWQGSLAVSQYEGIVSPAYYVCQISDEFYPRFVHYLLRSQPYVHLYRSVSKGIRPNQWDLPFDEFRSLEVLCPPLEEQRRIADFLDAESSRIDRLVLACRKSEDLLADRMRAVIDAAFEGDFHLSTPLKYLARIVDTEHKTAPHVPGGGFWIAGTSSARGGDLIHEQLYETDSKSYGEWTRRGQPRYGDILLSREAPVGEVAHYKEGDPPIAIGQRMVLITPGALLNSDYLKWSLLSSGVRRFVDDVTQGSLHPHLNMSDIGSIPIASLEIEEQAHVAQQVSTDVELTRRLSGARRRTADLLAERRQALITAAVTGQFDVSTASGRSITQGV